MPCQIYCSVITAPLSPHIAFDNYLRSISCLSPQNSDGVRVIHLLTVCLQSLPSMAWPACGIVRPRPPFPGCRTASAARGWAVWDVGMFSWSNPCFICTGHVRRLRGASFDGRLARDRKGGPRTPAPLSGHIPHAASWYGRVDTPLCALLSVKWCLKH